MTNHTDSSKEIEIPEEFEEWAESQANKYYDESTFGYCAAKETAIAAYRHLHPFPSPKKFFFSQDDSCHWYMIPVERREEWSKASDLNLDTDEGYDEWQNGNWEDYRTGGGIGDIEFTPTTSGDTGMNL